MCESKKKASIMVRPLTQRKNWKHTKKSIIRKVVATSLTKRTSNHFSLFLITILTLMLFSLASKALANSYTNITVSEAKTMIDSNPSLVVLDVRNQSEYDSGHIRNAKLIPVYELELRLDELDINDEILVYCKSGGRSSTASQILSNNGFLHIYNMVGGITAWVDEGYPVYVKYSSIQKAINNASEGDTIFVSSGTYHEHVILNKTVSLVGEDSENTIIQGNGTQTGLNIFNRNVNVTSFNIQNGTRGVYLTDYAYFCTITDCKLVNNTIGIFVKSGDNVLNRNVIVNNTESGIKIYASCSCSPVRGNIVTRNNLFNNSYGIQLINSDGSLVYHNNFIGNVHQATCSFGVNIWDNGYPAGGNYWGDYNGTDLYNGPEQNETGGDGIGDVPQDVYFGIIEDDFPLMAPINLFDAGVWNGIPYNVDVISNSSVSDFYFNPDEGAFLRFNVIGQDGTTGFSRVTIPKDLLWNEDGWTVYVGDDQATPTVALDDKYTYLYFGYNHSTKTIEIRGTHVIPEFPSLIILPLFMIATLLAVIVYKKKSSVE